jgi:hypothetical protein
LAGAASSTFRSKPALGAGAYCDFSSRALRCRVVQSRARCAVGLRSHSCFFGGASAGLASFVSTCSTVACPFARPACGETAARTARAGHFDCSSDCRVSPGHIRSDCRVSPGDLLNALGPCALLLSRWAMPISFWRLCRRVTPQKEKKKNYTCRAPRVNLHGVHQQCRTAAARRQCLCCMHCSCVMLRRLRFG